MTLKQSMLRALAYFTCAMTGSFLFALSFIRSDFKSLGDIFSGTQVQFDQSQNVLSYGAGTEFQLSLVDSIDNSEIDKVVYAGFLYYLFSLESYLYLEKDYSKSGMKNILK
jgi:hypothetical protein